MDDRITGRMNDGTVFVHSETGDEGVGHFTTQRRLPEIICKLARFEDKIENGELVEVVHGQWSYGYSGEKLGGTDATYDYLCSVCNEFAVEESNYCPNCGAKMDGKGADNGK